MKNKIKYFIVTFLILPAIALFSFTLSGCTLNPTTDTSNTVSVVNIEKTSTNGLVDTYTITYSDGSTTTFTITNGEDGLDGTNGVDGTSLSIEDLYDTAVDEGYTGSFLDFLEEYLTITIDTTKTAVATNIALRSAVSVYSNFTEETAYGTSAVTSAGSGIIYTLDKTTGSAYIITNYHVVYDAASDTANHISDDISVYLYGSELTDDAIDVTYVGGSMTYDIAVLQITNSTILTNSDAMAVTVADSNSVQVGENAIAVGNPEAEGISATSGIVSVDSEYITMTAADDVTSVTFRVMRVDTAINSGNSGGGLYNDDGELIGIVNAKVIEDGVENIGYAIPSTLAINVANNIIANSSVKKLILGVTIKTQDSRAVYDENTLSTTIVEDIVVDEITSGSIAEGMGLQVDDAISSVQINNTLTTITRLYQLSDILLSVRDGNQIILNVVRGGTNTTLTYTASSSSFTSIS